MFDTRELDLLRDALETLADGFSDLPDYEPQADYPAIAPVLAEVATRMRDNYPYFHPQYAGQMLKPPHAVARLAYALSLWINPNNHALDGGRASSAMEKECVAEIGRMYGWQSPLGHLTGGGTMANLEALWVAGRLHPDKTIVGSEQAHYTHSRISEVLGIPYDPLPTDRRGRIDVPGLAKRLEDGDVGTIVATMGNTGLGAVDPLPDILELAAQYDTRVHADAAYGGYFGLSSKLGEHARTAFDLLTEVDSIVVDPHKHGLQPYGCGCVLFKDPSVGSYYKHGSPYTYFSSDELHLGEISLECSRAGAAAVALWATMRLYPLVADGQFSHWLDDSIAAARALWQQLNESPHFVPLAEPDLDIVVYAASAPDMQRTSRRARELFAAAAERDLHLALIELPASLVSDHAPDIAANADTVTCLRSVLMKPEHRNWCGEIVAILEDCAAEL